VMGGMINAVFYLSEMVKSGYRRLEISPKVCDICH
jgi:hypothetical protein